MMRLDGGTLIAVRMACETASVAAAHASKQAQDCRERYNYKHPQAGVTKEQVELLQDQVGVAFDSLVKATRWLGEVLSEW